MHIRIEIRKAACWESCHLVGFKYVTHSNFEASRNDRHVLAKWMPVWRDLVSIRQLQPNGVVSTLCGRTPLNDGDLCSRRKKGRGGPPRNCLWGECVVRMRTRVTGQGKERTRQRQRCQCRQGGQQRAFHERHLLCIVMTHDFFASIKYQSRPYILSISFLYCPKLLTSFA